MLNLFLNTSSFIAIPSDFLFKMVLILAGIKYKFIFFLAYLVSHLAKFYYSIILNSIIISNSIV